MSKETKSKIKKTVIDITAVFFFPIFYSISVTLALIARARSANEFSKSRLVWGPIPIINNKYWSNAMRESGWISQTFTNSYYSTINQRSDFDEILPEKYKGLPYKIKGLIAFWETLFRFDVFFISFRGWLLGQTPYWRVEAHLLKLANKRIVAIPYGSDAFVYRKIKSLPLLHGLMMSYPAASRMQDEVEKRLHYWCRHADVVNPGMMGPDGFGRWDVLRPSSLTIDTKTWVPSTRQSDADGLTGTVYVAHAPNHRGFKGSEFVMDAIKRLQDEGLKVELVLIEKVQNEEVRRLFHSEVDILVEQLIATGHGINAIEGMACGLPVMSNLEDDTYTTIFRRWSFLDECPIVSASPETLINQLRKLIMRPKLRKQLGSASRQYVEKYHSYESAKHLFSNVLKYVYNDIDSLINLYHPLLGEYPRQQPFVKPPLVKNKILD
ncbi:MAG: glycosyltransferase [Cyanobacteria bacterium P01_A01_bin.137]